MRSISPFAFTTVSYWALFQPIYMYPLAGLLYWTILKAGPCLLSCLSLTHHSGVTAR